MGNDDSVFAGLVCCWEVGKMTGLSDVERCRLGRAGLFPKRVVWGKQTNGEPNIFKWRDGPYASVWYRRYQIEHWVAQKVRRAPPSARPPRLPRRSSPASHADLISFDEVVRLTGLNRVKIRRLMARSRFPRPVLEGEGVPSWWKRTDVEKWIDDRQRDLKAA